MQTASSRSKLTYLGWTVAAAAGAFAAISQFDRDNLQALYSQAVSAHGTAVEEFQKGLETKQAAIDSANTDRERLGGALRESQEKASELEGKVAACEKTLADERVSFEAKLSAAAQEKATLDGALQNYRSQEAFSANQHLLTRNTHYNPVLTMWSAEVPAPASAAGLSISQYAANSSLTIEDFADSVAPGPVLARIRDILEKIDQHTEYTPADGEARFPQDILSGGKGGETQLSILAASALATVGYRSATIRYVTPESEAHTLAAVGIPLSAISLRKEWETQNGQVRRYDARGFDASRLIHVPGQRDVAYAIVEPETLKLGHAPDALMKATSILVCPIAPYKDVRTK